MQILWPALLLIIGTLFYPVARRLGVPYLTNVLGYSVFAYTVWLFSNFTSFKIASFLSLAIYSSIFLPLTVPAFHITSSFSIGKTFNVNSLDFESSS